MSGKVVVTLITATWLTMMYGLIRDDVVPAVRRAREIARSASYEQLDRLVPESRVDQMGIYMGGDRVGESVRWILKRDPEIVLKSRTEINLAGASSLGLLSRYLGGVHAVIHFRATVFQGRLVEFTSSIAAPPKTPPLVSVEGKPLGDVLQMTIRRRRNTQVQTVPFDQRQFIANSLAPGLSFRDLKVGRKWRMKNFDPLTRSMTTVLAEVVGKEKIVNRGEELEAFKVRLTQGMRKIRVWVTAAGEVVKQQFGPFTFVREAPSQEALEELKR